LIQKQIACILHFHYKHFEIANANLKTLLICEVQGLYRFRMGPKTISIKSYLEKSCTNSRAASVANVPPNSSTATSARSYSCQPFRLLDVFLSISSFVPSTQAGENLTIRWQDHILVSPYFTLCKTVIVAIKSRWPAITRGISELLALSGGNSAPIPTSQIHSRRENNSR
jgi:hypothetical protein